MNLILSQAEKYLELGLSVIPLKPRSKNPLLKSWSEYQVRKPTLLEINDWFKSGLENIGIVLGKVSNLIVLDADSQKGISWLLEHKLHSPVSVLSGEGKHLWFKYNGEKTSYLWKGQNEHEEVRLRSDGLYIVAPPSIHPSGLRYRFSSLMDPVLLVTKRPGFPTGILSVVADKKDISPSQEKQESWISEALEEMKNGHIHNTLVSVLGKFRFHGFSIEDTYKLLRPYAYEDNQPFEGLRDKIEEIWERYEPGNVYSLLPLQKYRPMQEGLVIRSPANESDFRNYESLATGTEVIQLRAGFRSLDAMLEGGLRSERLFTIAARTGENKTNTCLTICKNLCEQDKKVLYFSTEFSYRKIWERYINQLQDPTRFRQHAFFVCDSFAPNLAMVEKAIGEIKPDVFVFDHVNHIAEEVRPLGEFMQGCNYLMRKYNNQGVIIAQLNRSADWVEKGQRVEPRLSMLKGSGTLEQASSRVLLLSEMRVSPEFDEIRAVLAKNDSGTKGIFMLALRKQPHYRIEELA